MKKSVTNGQSSTLTHSSPRDRGFFRWLPSTGHWALATLLLLTACGFQPVHGAAQRTALANRLESVRIVTEIRQETRLAQWLKAEIQDGINPNSAGAEKLFTLKITVTEVEISLFINPDGTSSRGDLQYNSTYTLTRSSDGAMIDSGTLTRTSSYNISENADYATFVSREDARKRGLTELAQDYKLRLANLLPDLNAPTYRRPKPPIPTVNPMPSTDTTPMGTLR